MQRWWLIAGLALVLVQCRQAELSEKTPVGATSLFDHADSLYRAAKYEEAANAYAELGKRFAAESNQAAHWRARLWWVKSIHYLGRHQELAGQFEPLLEMSGGDSIREAWTRCTRGMVHARAARFDEALSDGTFGLEIALARNEPALTSACYDTLVTALSNSGRNRESLAFNEKRLAIERARTSNPFELADALNDIGVDYRHLGYFEEAIRVYEEGFALFQKLENPEGMAKVLFNMGSVYRALGDGQKDLSLKRRSLAYAEKMGHAFGLGLLHGDLGEIFHKAGNFGQARVHLDDAIAIGRRANLPLVVVNALEDLGRTETAAGNHARAREVLAEGIAIADEKKIEVYRSQIRSAAARNEAADGRAAKAIALADEALRIARKIDDPEVEFEALEARALALEADRHPGACAAFLEGVELLESWRGRLALGDLRIGVAERRLGVYEGAIRLLLERGEVDRSLEIAERARARVLLGLMAEQDARQKSQSAEDDLKQRLRETYEARRSVRQSLRPALDRQIAELTSRLAAAESRTRAANPAASRLRNPSPATIAEIRQSLLSDGETLLTYFWGDRDVYGWWLDQGGGRGARLGTAESLAPIVDYARLSVEQGAEWRGAASRAFRSLVLPLCHPERSEGSSARSAQHDPKIPREVHPERGRRARNDTEKCTGRKLFVVPDGPVSNLPLEVLISGNKRPWGATTEFIYGPSASVLLALSRRGPAPQYSRNLLAVGDPRGARFPTLASLTPARQGEFSALPYASREVRWITRILGRKSDVLLGAEATTLAWLSRRPERYRYLHFATHARIDDRQPMKTALTMADGELQVQRIRKMSLQPELVTLSACQTALGPRVRGEGVIGLPHAFLSAGARGVIVTLWRVPDQSTAEFVRDLYSEIQKGSTPSRALHRVRQRWIESGAPPSQWASFIVIGGNA